MSSTYQLGAEMLACAFTLAGTNTPTPAELSAALAEIYPGGKAPTVADLLAVGWLVPAISDRTRLRLPPVSLAKVSACLVAPNAPSAAPAPPVMNEVQPAAAPYLFSYYRGGITVTAPYKTITPAQLFAVLTSDRHRATTEALRAAPVGSPQRTELKKSLDYVTPAGTFTRRANGALAEASGLLVLDFDHLLDLPAARAALLADADVGPAIALLFTSPSGDGLKAIVETDPVGSHLENFQFCAEHLTEHYADLGLIPDKSGKDVARACFVPYDPAAWLAPAFAA
ncbi:hypothetical protein FNT36_18620 [Hymenobacter setariae]|uniref:BT4734-like N-terminal domain-containing protein n=1 Tax=Hymenobacter setariae TaxID=2594794 RepID=A0A558BSY9_9BACT|nr:BT4734/BF3469 family protein [Hymenobacter setariae]TVT39656.1 hypothetical protein FNT36_18620 [Hymenobacter setariae]